VHFFGLFLSSLYEFTDGQKSLWKETIWCKHNTVWRYRNTCESVDFIQLL